MTVLQFGVLTVRFYRQDVAAIAHITAMTTQFASHTATVGCSLSLNGVRLHMHKAGVPKSGVIKHWIKAKIKIRRVWRISAGKAGQHACLQRACTGRSASGRGLQQTPPPTAPATASRQRAAGRAGGCPRPAPSAPKAPSPLHAPARTG